MTRRGLKWASILIMIGLLAVAIFVGNSLPEGTQLPVHWGMNGQPDRFADHWQALLMPALITGGASLIFHFLPSLEPRREGLKRSQGLYLWAWAGLLLIGIALQLVTVSTALGWNLPAERIVAGAAGVMLVLIGNQLGKSRSMYMVGIRTPWTLASEEVWMKTHRLGGKLMVAAGLILAFAAATGLAGNRLALIGVPAIAIAALVPVAYSFILWRKERARDQSSR